MMDYKKLREEELREAACLGDLVTLTHLISTGVDVNSRNPVNGWTALHWAACRGNVAAVKILLQNGANKHCVNDKLKIPIDLASTLEVHSSLLDEGSYCEFEKSEVQYSITPNYLKNPPLSCPNITPCTNIAAEHLKTGCEKGLVLKLRVCTEPDEFVEVEIPHSNLTFEELKLICAEELNEDPEEIRKIMKLPNTLIRNDKDVLRLEDFQEIACIF